MVDFITAIGLLSSIETLEAGIRSVVSDGKQKITEKKLNQKLNELGLVFRDEILNKFKEEYVSEKLDELIAAHCYNHKPKTEVKIFGDKDKELLIAEFWEKHPDLRQQERMIAPIIDNYFRILNALLNEKISYDSKLILDRMNSMEEHVVGLLENKTVVRVPMQWNGENIAHGIESILALIQKNIDKDFRSSVRMKDNYYKFTDMDDMILKLSKIFSLIDKEKIEAAVGSTSRNYVDSLVQFVLYTIQDGSIEMNAYYQKVVLPVLTFIETYEVKNNDFYWSIGKMGMDIGADDKIMEHIIGVLHQLFLLMKECLEEKWKTREYDEQDKKVTIEMHRFLLREIEHLLTGKRKEFVKEIWEENKITDQELAKRHNMPVRELRRLLYPATKSFLRYSYVDNETTMIYIQGRYQQTIQYFFEREGKGED